MIYGDMERHSRLFSSYTELRVQEIRNVNVSVLNGDVVGNHRGRTSGVSARSYVAGAWGFASSPMIDDESISRTIAAASSNARFLSSRDKRGEKSLPAASGIGTYVESRTPRFSHEDYIDFVRALDAYLAEKYPELQSRNVYFGGLEIEKHLLTSGGSASSSLVPRTLIAVIISHRTVRGDSVEVSDLFGGRGFFEDWFDEPSALFPKLEELCGRLALKAEGVYPETGVHDVILGSDLAGILAHEAVGHTVEADNVLGGSVAADYLNERVGSDLVNMTDFAHTALGQPCPQPVRIDDEGTPARDAALIENGVLRSYMHNRETAGRFGVEPTGNARAWSFSDEPLVRMRNTAVLPGHSSLDEMIASIGRGYYLERPSGGQADSTGEFMFGVMEGREIRNGKLASALLDTTVSGVAFEMLKTVTMLSKDIAWNCAGMCGKKQPMVVGMGGPAVKCRLRIGGRR